MYACTQLTASNGEGTLCAVSCFILKSLQTDNVSTVVTRVVSSFIVVRLTKLSTFRTIEMLYAAQLDAQKQECAMKFPVRIGC